MKREAARAADLLRRNVDFRRYWLGQTLSALGSSLTSLVVPLLVLAATHRPALAGAVAMARLLALNMARVPGGVLADRWSRQRVLVAADAGKAVVWAVPAVLLATHRSTVAVLLVVAALDGALSAVYNPAAAAVLSRVVPQSQVTRALSLNQARSVAAGLVGPGLGGALLAVRPWLPLALDAATFLGCAVLTARIGADLGGRTAGARLLTQARIGMRFVRRQPFLLALTAWSALMNVTTAAAFFGITPILAGAGAKPTTIGLVSGGMSVGALVGALAAPRVARLRGFTVLVWSGAASVAFAAAAAAAPRPAVVAVALTLLSALGPLLVVVLTTRVYALVPDDLMGRVQSALLFAGSALYPFGPLAFGWLLQTGGAAAAYAAVTAGLAGCLALSFTRPIRRELSAPARSRSETPPPPTGSTKTRAVQVPRVTFPKGVHDGLSRAVSDRARPGEVPGRTAAVARGVATAPPAAGRTAPHGRPRPAAR